MITANQYLCFICSKISKVLEAEKWGAPYCDDLWKEIELLYTYYISILTGCELPEDYFCKIEGAIDDFTSHNPVLTASKTCSITVTSVTPAISSCPTITITKL